MNSSTPHKSLQYTIERHKHGWLICGANGGVPMNALQECNSLFDKNTVLDVAITHHLRSRGHNTACICIVTKSEGELWRKAIAESITHLPAEEKWWCGLDVGTSSAAIFSVLAASSNWKYAAADFSKGATPRDAGDFERCRKLLNLFPAWRVELSKVAAAYPETKWPKLVEQWATLEALSPESLNKALQRF